MRTVLILLLTMVSSLFTNIDEAIKVRQEVALVGQDKSNACWVASSAMMLGWKEQQSLSIDATLSFLDGGAKGNFRSTYLADKGLPLTDLNLLIKKVGLKAEAPANYSIDYYKAQLKKGPLMVIYMVSSSVAHAVVVYGIEGDGTSKGTFLLINDPWPKAGSPSASNNQGGRLRLNMNQYSSYYENFVKNLPAKGNLIAQVYRF